MDVEAFPFHFTEPGHLAFRKLVDGHIQSFEHRFVVQLILEVLGKELVFQAVANQLIGIDAAVYQLLNFLNHPVVEALLKALGDAGTDKVALALETENDGGYGLAGSHQLGVFLIVDFNFDGADKAGAFAGVGVVVQGLEGSQHLGEFFIGLLFQLLSQGGVVRYGEEFVALEQGFDVHTASAAENDVFASVFNILDGLVGQLLVLEDIVFDAWFHDVDQMVGNVGAVETVVVQILAGADVHTAIDLSRVGADDFSVDAEGEGGGETGFSSGGGAE